MKATSKLRQPLPSADRPLLRVRGRFLSDNANMPITCILRYFQKCAKLRTFVSERVNRASENMHTLFFHVYMVSSNELE